MAEKEHYLRRQSQRQVDASSSYFMFTGLPYEHGVGFNFSVSAGKIETITGILKKNGYRTWASNNPFVGLSGLSRK